MNSKDLTVAALSSGTTDSATERYTIMRGSTALAASRGTVEAIRERAAATSSSRILEVTAYEVGYTDLPTPPDFPPEAPRP